MSEKEETKGSFIPELLDVDDLAELLRVSKQTARRYITEGKIPAYRVAFGRYLISVSQLTEYVEEMAEGGSRGKVHKTGQIERPSKAEIDTER